jgi:effector-binding domain-containing protein
MKIPLSAVLALLLSACTTPMITQVVDNEAPPATVPGVEITRAPYTTVAADWKERMDTLYVYVEHHGDYRELGAAIRELQTQAAAAGMQPTGPLFALYFDDPGRTRIDALRSRACLPVAFDAEVPAGLRRATLPQATVAYAVVAGAYPEVPRAFPGLFRWMHERNWVQDGPLRQVYLVDPGSVASWDELLTEVQVPWTPGG